VEGGGVAFIAAELQQLAHSEEDLKPVYTWLDMAKATAPLWSLAGLILAPGEDYLRHHFVLGGVVAGRHSVIIVIHNIMSGGLVFTIKYSPWP
jgi:hypothetical protein